MIFLKLLLNIIILYDILTSIGTIASCYEENLNDDPDFTSTYRLSDRIIPYHYSIQMLWPDDQSEITNLHGECHIYIKINYPMRRIRLHAKKPQINITSAVLKKDTNKNEKEIYYIPRNETYNNNNHILNFYFAENIPSGYYFFMTKFISFLNDDNKSIFKISYLNSTGYEKWLYATHFQTIGARQIFPCWDEPQFKASFNISIKHHKKYKILSNVKYNSNHLTNSTNMEMRSIFITPEISTYQLAFCLLTDEWIKFAILVEYDDDITTGLSQLIAWHRNIHFTQIHFTKIITGKIVMSFKEDWKNIEKIPRIQFVLIPGLLHNAIEKWGLVFFRETAVIYDKNVDSLAHKIEVICLIARQVAYQWFGITVSPSWWSYHWLNQGIATLLGIDILQSKYFEMDFRTPDLFVVQIQQESLRLDRTSSIMRPLIAKNRKPFEINSLFSFSFYIKAPAILRMLRFILTDETFKEGIKKFYKTQSATFDDFCDDMQIVYEERKRSYTETLIIKDMMRAWTSYVHYPVLIAKTKKDTSTLILEIENSEALQLSHTWWIPITIATRTQLDFTISANEHDIEWMKVSELNYFEPYLRYLFLKENEWYIINIQQMGYYRVNYESKNWKNIARYLNSTNYRNIHVLNRAQIIDDAYHFMMKGTLKFSIFLKLMEYLWRETDYVAWYPMFKALEDISRIIPFQDERFNIFKTKILNSLNGLLKNIGYNKKPNEKLDDLIDCLRQEASKWACILGEINCVKVAETKLHQHLVNQTETNTLMPWWKHWTFCNGLMRANFNMWYKAWKLIPSQYLACCNDNILGYIVILFDNLNTKMRDKILNDILYVIARHANNDKVLDYTLKNLRKIPREYIIATLIDIINNVHSNKQLNKIKESLTIEYISEQQLLFDEVLKINWITKIDKLISLINHKIEIRNSEILRHFRRFTKII